MQLQWNTHAMEGEFLRQYQILRVLGRGPTGVSYHVIDQEISKEFVLKALCLGDHLDPQWLDRLAIQTTLLTKLTHKGIDRVFDRGQSEHLWFLVKDFVDDGLGGSCNLHDYLQFHGGKLPPFQILEIAHQLIDVLEYVYDYQDSMHKECCHGNLKPENILLENVKQGEGVIQLKITDFQPFGLITGEVIFKVFGEWMSGLSKYSTFVHEEAVRNTLKGIYKAFDYQPPERQLEKEKVFIPSISSDIYSLGVIIYELLMGSLPYGWFSWPTEVYPALDTSWDKFLQMCLEKDPSKRCRSYDELRKVLLSCEEEKSRHKTQEEPLVSSSSLETLLDKTSPQKARQGVTPAGMVFIPPGTFFVGNPECGEDASPMHEVSLPGFYLDRTPVTNAQFAHFVQETGYKTQAERYGGGALWIENQWKILETVNWKAPLGRKTPLNFDQHPVTQVTYEDAVAYATWLGRRLPTEQEWEYAASAGKKGVRYPWGDTITKSQANFASDGTTPVTRYQPNSFGIYDLCGNVWEWTSSWYEGYPGNENASSHFGQRYKVVRGGAWFYDGKHCMISYRNANDPSHSYPTVGFRTACDLNY